MNNQHPDPETELGYTVMRWVGVLAFVTYFDNYWQVECFLAWLALGKKSNISQQEIERMLKDRRDNSLGKMEDASVPEPKDDPREFLDINEEANEEGADSEPDEE